MSQNFAILLAFTSIVTICTSLPDYHKLMSPTQLQSVFHVDSVDAVPHYEVIQLLHHSFDDGAATAPLPEHYRRRRRRSISSINTLDTGTRPTTLKQPHHVKKDLSKNPYYSKLKEAANVPGAGGVNSLQQAEHVKFVGDLKELNEQHNVSLNAFGENLNLNLKRTDGLFKGGSAHTLRMWTVRSEPNATHGLDMQEVLDEDAQSSDQIGEVYQDEANMAAILMRRHLETGDLIMEGSIGHEMVIKPLPHELSPNPDAAHHVVYKREAQPLEHLSDFAFMEPDDLATSDKLERLQQRRQRRSAPIDDDEAALDELDDELENFSAEASRTRNKRQVPYTIYPEVLVIIDYDGYRLHGGDNLQVKRYFVSFWNGVDLRYRLLKGPRIRISIAGIIISRGRDATPYLERNRVGRDAIDSAAALTDMGKYLFRERRLPVYDIAVAITKLDMCRRTTAFGECNRGTAGFAYVGGACVVNKRLEKVNSVAIIEDTGGFSGIIVAAHEVGHLLGAVHDGSPPPSYLGGPGAQRCRWEDGYIMSDLRHTERGFRWSPCTVQSFHHFLNGDTATCLHNAPHEDSALGRALPGTLLSLDAQCRRDRGTYACFKDERVCAQLFCFDAQTGYCVAYRPAAEGSTCGNGMQCLDGRCTPLLSNVISTYRSGNENIGKNIEYNNEEDGGEENDEEEDDDDDEENISDEKHQDNHDSSNPKRKTNNIHTYTPQKQTDTQLDNNNNSNERQVELSTFEFLARFLAQNPQWQQLLGQAVLQANALTSAAATNDANVAAKQNSVQQEQKEQNRFPQGMVVVKTSVSSSTSTSYGDISAQDVSKSSSSSRNSTDDNSRINSAEVHMQEKVQITKDSESGEIEILNEATSDTKGKIGNKEIKILQKTTENSVTDPKQKPILTRMQPTIETQTPTLSKLTQIQQQKQINKTRTQSTAPQPSQQANLFQYYTHELRKQLQYYLGLLRARATPDSVSSSDSSSTRGSIISSVSISDGNKGSNNSSISRGIATDTQNAAIQTNNSNYSNIVSVAAKLQQQTTQLQDEQNDDSNNDSDDDDNEDDVNVDVDADVDDESNEAIDDKQQKRKFPTTTSVNAQQDHPAQQHQQHTQRLQQAPPPSAPTRSSNSINNSSNNNNNKGLQRPATFIDAYLKKLQSLNTPPDVKTSITATTTSTTMSTSSVVGKPVIAETHEKETEKRAKAETFGSHFLKRTPYLSSRNSAGSASIGSSSSSSNSADDADSVGNSSSSNNEHGSSSDNNTNHQQNRNYKKLSRKQQQEHSAKVTTKSNSGELRIRTTTQQPAYVTNYIGDNTNTLTRLLDQPEQQQQEQQSSLTKTTITTATTSSSQQTPQQQKAHKVKTQKLIRRQLLRTQIK